MEAFAHGWLGWFVATFAGLSVGSFANVAIHRVPLEGLSVMRPRRSFCPSCGTQLAWTDNVPVLAWLLLRGRCRYCSTAIPVRYPVVELLVAALFVVFWYLRAPSDGAGIALLLVDWTLVATCVVVSMIDLDHTIIPDVITYPGMALGLLVSLVLPQLHAGHAGFNPESPHGSAIVVALLGLAAGAGSLWLVGRLGNLFLARQMEEAGVEDAMGLGDVKWMGLAGTVLGPILVLEAILAACFFGALVGVLMKVGARVFRRESPVGLPFGPFLSAGILLELGWPGSVWNVLQLIGGT